ncbi:SAM-dependent methyltransferase [Trinickia dabaoshanensis]|uniref:SAM-dependent methyltransferase n=1 Tax=Trinickia dabaoshanensis TaxID=564714 RepID=A0A2N7VG71_9BURK|nr:class I SAM-dependent methyltransferase [Trinickia dabaoshanensis]PMS16149.1 SAM-dependent methyltransferase [Trinickia dabaoshanensis]
MSTNVPGTEGYAEEAPALIAKWRDVSFENLHRPVLHLVPKSPARVLDLGSGMGRDAAALAAMGHSVVAVEPVDELRVAATSLYPAPNIHWFDDSLPELATITKLAFRFNAVLITAVWMHLDESQRQQGMHVIGKLIEEDGHLIMSLRHGPTPIGRRMFDVSAAETIALAEAHGLALVLNAEAESVQQGNRRSGVTWTWLGFKKARISASPYEQPQVP